jgi:hypothetical protein
MSALRHYVAVAGITRSIKRTLRSRVRERPFIEFGVLRDGPARGNSYLEKN